jgi:hypothetical protein
VSQKGFPKVGRPIKVLCDHSVLIFILEIEIIALQSFPLVERAKQCWHDSEVIGVLDPNLLRPEGEQYWPYK